MTTQSALSPTQNYTNRDYETILADLTDVVKKTRPTAFSDFLESNLGMMLLELMSYMGDHLSYGQDSLAIELFLSTARRYESALRFCRSVGYVPRSAVPAEVLVQSVTLPDILTTNGGKILAGSILRGDEEEGVQYELLEDVFILPGDNFAQLQLYEGQSYEDTFDPSSSPGQVITSTHGVVADASWSLFVGDPDNAANEWTEVDAVAFERGATKTYEVSFDGEGRLSCRFGDGSQGKIPDQPITLKYRTTQGSAGNAPILAVRGTVRATVSGNLGAVSITFENQNGSASGGKDRETLEELRINVPAYIRSLDKVLTLDDYDTALRQLTAVALVYTDVSSASYGGNVVTVHVWDTQDGTFTSESPVEGRSSTVSYTSFAQVAQNQVNEIQEYLRARTLVTVHNVIARPTSAWVDLYLGTIDYDSRFDRGIVHEAITQAVVDVFEASSGFALRVSDLYRAIDSAQGVLQGYIERIVVERLSPAYSQGTITFKDGYNPADGEWLIINDGSAEIPFEFDSDSNVGTDPILGPRTPVTIGPTVDVTAQNLMVAIQGALNMRAAYNEELADAVVLLTHEKASSAYNIPIILSPAVDPADIEVYGMTGGGTNIVTALEDYRREQAPPVGSDKWEPGPYQPSTVNGSIAFVRGQNASAGDWVEFHDGVSLKRFDFHTGVYGGTNIGVEIGATALDTLNSLQAALAANVSGDHEVVSQADTPAVYITLADANAEITLEQSSDVNRLVINAASWLTGGQPFYKPIQDILIEAANLRRRYYDGTYLYNNEIYYDSGIDTGQTVQAINLRRLVFELQPV